MPEIEVIEEVAVVVPEPAKVKAKPKVKVKVKARQDTVSRLLAAITRTKPRTKDAPSFEVSRFGGEVMSRVKYVLKTGIASFDDLTGCIPFGRITEIYGVEAAGKTALVMRATVAAQKKEIYRVNDDKSLTKVKPGEVDVTVLYIDNEQSLDNDEKLVIEGTEVEGVLCRCDTIDQIFKICAITIDQLEAVEKEQKRPQLLLVIVDTIAGTSTNEEMSSDWNKEDYDRRAKGLRKGFRRLMRRIASRQIAMICTNQISDKYQLVARKGRRPTLPQDEDFSTPGGRAVKFFARLRVFLYCINKQYKLVKGSKFAAGFVSGFYTSKNNRVKPCREGRFVLLYEGGLNDILSRFETMVTFKNIAAYNDAGEITLRYEKNGIVPTTYGNETSLEEDADAADAGEDRGYKLPQRYQWLAYYEKHKKDIDALWQKCIYFAFQIEGLSGQLDADDEAGNLDELEDLTIED